MKKINLTKRSLNHDRLRDKLEKKAAFSPLQTRISHTEVKAVI